MSTVTTSNLYNTAGIQLPKDACIVIVRTEWNAETINKLEEGCIRIFTEKNVQYKIITVPGAFEIPFGIKN
ncbi:MAG: 6,7-dimethyl-8-ribityllumazine synthase, partial [Sphingobacteriales bacterium]|nr:6,7-dimethyl-8-ribityllumazine synthase [Sphingobacteriales bacterium]